MPQIFDEISHLILRLLKKIQINSNLFGLLRKHELKKQSNFWPKHKISIYTNSAFVPGLGSQAHKCGTNPKTIWNKM